MKSTTGKAIIAEYDRLIESLGSEFAILRELPVAHIREFSQPAALAIERMRAGEVYREPGFDGVYGTIKVFRDSDERLQTLNQLALL